jgi:uncharacterized protein (DUF362 family)
MSNVVIVRGRNIFSPGKEISEKILAFMLEKGFSILMEQKSHRDSLKSLFPQDEKIGIKINTIGGKNISTRPAVALSLARMLSDDRSGNRDVIIWDRTNRELKEAGYKLQLGRSGIRIFGTDTQGVGYNPELVSHLNIGSLFSSIQADQISSSISLAILKDHGLAGVTAGMKNYFGAVHNPNKYHDTNCNPYVAEVFDTDTIKQKHRLTVLDGLIVQYHKGPAFHPRWADQQGLLIFSLDPVAADVVGWQVIKKLRSQKGLPSLQEENREPQYLKTAEKMGLGKATLSQISVIEEEV